METTLESQLKQQANELTSTLLKSLETHERGVLTKYAYYDADHETRDFGVSTPRALINIRPGIGWASRAVHTLSDRVVFDGFARDNFGINDLLNQINGFSVISQAKTDAFIAGCSFVAVGDGEDGQKVLVPFTALEATGAIDQTTGLLKYGLAVTKWQNAKDLGLTKNGSKISKKVMYAPADFMLFTPEYTAMYKGRTLLEIVPNLSGRTLLHPITHRASANAPLGKSRLTKTARRVIQEVGRLKRREEIAEEFYSLPQRYINGIAEGAQKDPNLDQAIGKVWAINKDDEGEKPEIGQLPQMSIDGFIGAKKDKARDFCAETALTLRNLGYETGNPTSAEALATMSDDLLLEATNSQEEMGQQIKEICITLRLATDGNNVVPDQLNEIIPAWKPIFQLDIGAAGDAIFKLTQAMPEIVGTVAGYKLLGIGVREAEELVARREALKQSAFMSNGESQ